MAIETTGRKTNSVCSDNFGNTWRHLSQLGMGVGMRYWHSVVGSQGCCYIVYEAQDNYCYSQQGVQFSSVPQSCLTLCSPMDCSMSGLPVHQQLPELAQTQVHWVGDAIQPSHPLSSLLLLPSIFPSIRVFPNESVLRHQVAKVLDFQLQHQSFQGIFRADFL